MFFRIWNYNIPITTCIIMLRSFVEQNQLYIVHRLETAVKKRLTTFSVKGKIVGRNLELLINPVECTSLRCSQLFVCQLSAVCVAVVSC